MLKMAEDPEGYGVMSWNAARSVAMNWEIQAQTRVLEGIYDEANGKLKVRS